LLNALAQTALGLALMTFLLLGPSTRPAMGRLPGDAPTRTQTLFEDGAIALARIAPDDPRLDYDVLHYALDLTVDLDDARFDGTVRIALRAETELLRVVLDCGDNLGPTSVTSRSGPCTVTRLNKHQIECVLPASLGENAVDTLAVVFGGQPGPAFLSGYRFFAVHNRVEPVVQSLSVPDRAHTWWPCKDLPEDKATSETRITAPALFTCASNGLLIDRVENGDGTATTHWRTAYPMVTYNVSFALAEYVSWTDTYVSELHGRSIPIVNYVFREDSLDARADLSVTGEAMTLFERLFGAYPFADPVPGVEKYGHAEVSWNSAMEHQTMTHLGSGFINGRNTSDWAVAHELSHQWFGNSISLVDYRDMWLNEGFATYCEALFAENRGGLPAYHAWLQQERRAPTFRGPVVDPEAIYGSTVYQKGAWVLHMLRGRLRLARLAETGDATAGDAAFAELLHTYANALDQRHGSTTTLGFIVHCEEQLGEDLDGFFSPWLYGEGRIELQVGWSAVETGAGSRLVLNLAQTQPPVVYPNGEPTPRSPSIYPTLWEVRARSAAGDSLSFVVEQTERFVDFEETLPWRPVSVEVDPDQWLLREILTLPSLPLASRVELAIPSVTADVSEIRYAVTRGAADLEIFDVRGRRVRRLVEADDRVGRHTASWDLRDDSGESVASGVYFARLDGPGSAADAVRIIVQR